MNGFKKLPVPVRHLKIDPGTRIEHFPLHDGATAALRAAGVRWAGIDYLVPEYLTGSPVSPTHLIYIPLSGAVECDFGRGFLPLAPGQMLVAPAGTPHWVRLLRGRCDGFASHLEDIPRWRHLGESGGEIRPVYDLDTFGAIARIGLRESASTAPGCR